MTATFAPVGADVSGLVASIAAKQDAATAATDVELAAAVAGPAANPQPSDSGLLGWTYDHAMASGASTPLVGTHYAMRIPVHASITPAQAAIITGAAGAGGALANCFLALVDRGGVLRGRTADQSGSWASLGMKAAALVPEAGQSLTIPGSDGYCYVLAFIGTQMTTGIQWSRLAANAGSTNGLQTQATTPPARWLTKATAWPPPGTIDFATFAVASLSIWAGLL